MTSKAFYCLIISCLITMKGSYAQMDTTNVEIWGIPKGYTESSYMQVLNQRKVTQCMASLRPAGFKDAYVMGLDNIRLVTLRNIPIYSFNPVIKQRQLYPCKKIIELLYFGINDDESDFIKNAYFDLSLNDTSAINTKINLYKQYGLQVDKQKIIGKFRLISGTDPVNRDSCLYFLKTSNERMLREAALLAYMSQVKNTDDMVAVFPLFMDNDLGIAMSGYISNYFEHHQLDDQYWLKYHRMFTLLLNNPEPFAAGELMKLYGKSDCCKKYVDEILKDGSITIKEILNARRPECKEPKWQNYLAERKGI
jgi:hypothetical protein